MDTDVNQYCDLDLEQGWNPYNATILALAVPKPHLPQAPDHSRYMIQ